MQKSDYYDYSPIRIFEKCTNGGLKAGEIGLVTSKKGLGKTSVLVQFGMDALSQEKQLVHVSFDQHSSNVISWYESIFNETAKKRNISSTTELKAEMVRNRTILNFGQENFSLNKVVNTLKALKDGGINVSAVVIDGIDLSKVSEDDMKAVSDFAKAESLTIWFSTTAEGKTLNDSAPEALQSYFDAVIHLNPTQEGVFVSVVKMNDMEATENVLRLDSKTLLMIAK